MTPGREGPPRRGRPRDPRRVEAVVQAARLILALHGFERTSKNDIATASRESKTMVYNHFLTKEAV